MLSKTSPCIQRLNHVFGSILLYNRWLTLLKMLLNPLVHKHPILSINLKVQILFLPKSRPLSILLPLQMKFGMFSFSPPLLVSYVLPSQTSYFTRQRRCSFLQLLLIMVPAQLKFQMFSFIRPLLILLSQNIKFRISPLPRPLFNHVSQCKPQK